MALITPSVLFDNIRGSIGGTTFSRSRAGLVAKRKPNGRKSYTNKQANVLKVQIYITGQWQYLTTVQQALWNAYADLYLQVDRFGTSKRLSGFNWFVHMNNLKYTYSSTILSVPPARVSAVVIDPFTLNLDNTTIGITFDAPINYAENLLFLFATLPNQLSRTTNRGKLRLIKTIDNAAFTTLDLTVDYNNAFGIDYASIANNSNFKLQLCMYSVNKISWMNSISLCSNSQLVYVSVPFRITENNNVRITENNNNRILED